MLSLAAAILAVLVQGPDDQQPPDQGWPRERVYEGNKIVAYQPQIESWDQYSELHAAMAFSVTMKGETDERYGSIDLTAQTKTDFQTRMVLVTDVKIREVHFPSAEKVDMSKAAKFVRDVVGGESITVSLDRILAGLQRAKQQQHSIEVNMEPPPIYYSDRPAILVQFMGPPVFERIKGIMLHFAVNTNWDLFLDKTTSRYYLLDDDTWLATEDLDKGPWTPAGDLPAVFRQLPAGEDWDDVRKHVPGKKDDAVPTVFVIDRPAELIVTDGPPAFVEIPGTHLAYATNTESDLFKSSGDEQYYFLVAGRWFRAAELQGPWTNATGDLPADFAKIPGDHAQSDVLASVPGTVDASEAVIQASIPRRATIKRADTTIVVVYDGEPKFEAIYPTTIHTAINTPSAVFRCEDEYYACDDGVWFSSASATGPWVVCDKIPAAIYEIPANHPKHYVTYVYVYDSTPDQVVVGYTAGYRGSYVVSGLVMFGAGYWLAKQKYDDNWWCYGHPPCYFSYGCGAYYSHYHGTYYRASHYYGPYGGAGRGAIYNPHTGGWARGAYAYGPAGGRAAAEGYNPWTGRYGRTVQGSIGYASWGRSVVASENGWARTGHVTTPGGRTRGFETSGGAKGITHRGASGNFGVVKGGNNNVFVGHDGNIYRRDQNGNWEQRHGNGWSREQAKGLERQARPTPATRNPRAGLSGAGRVEYDSRARSRGDSRSHRYSRPQVRGLSRSASRPGRSGSFGGGARGASRGGSRGGFGGGGRRR